VSRSVGGPGLPSTSASLDLQTVREHGAVLKTHDRTHILNAPSTDVFKEYMHKNYRSWVRFGQDNYHSVDYDNLVIVTGVDLTSSCNMLAYQKNFTDMSASFSLDAAAFGSASLSTWKHCRQPEGSWTSSGSDAYLAGLSLPATDPSMTAIGSTSPLPRQCIFLRGWRSRSRRRAPERIQAGAGPDDVAWSPPDPSEPDNQDLSYEEGASDTSSDVEINIVPITDSSAVRAREMSEPYFTDNHNSLPIRCSRSSITCLRYVYVQLYTWNWFTPLLIRAVQSILQLFTTLSTVFCQPPRLPVPCH
jgi:hypothetical protein